MSCGGTTDGSVESKCLCRKYKIMCVCLYFIAGRYTSGVCLHWPVAAGFKHRPTKTVLSYIVTTATAVLCCDHSYSCLMLHRRCVERVEKIHGIV